MNIQAICDGVSSAMTFWMQGIVKHSKHNIDIRQFAPTNNPLPDLVYFHYGSLIQGNYPFLEKHPEIPCGLCMAGPGDFSHVVNWIREKPERGRRLGGVIVLGSYYDEAFRSHIKGIPTHICEIGVDTSLFPRKTSPRTFRIGYAENNHYPLSDCYFQQFLSYGFPTSTAGNGKGTERQFHEMLKFYENISVLIDNTQSPRPGGLMFLESASVGRPCIAMKTGITADWFPREFLAEDEYDVVKKLNKLRDDPEYYQYASDLWRMVAENREYSIVSREYDIAFEAMIKNNLIVQN